MHVGKKTKDVFDNDSANTGNRLLIQSGVPHDRFAEDAGYFQKSIPLRHPLIFYLGHTAPFFVNKLVLAKLLPERIDPRMESIFAVGVDEMILILFGSLFFSQRHNT